MKKFYLALGILIVAIILSLIFLKMKNNNQTQTNDNQNVNEEQTINENQNLNVSAINEADKQSHPENDNQQKEEASDLKIETLQAGTGQEVKNGDLVSVHYKGILENGKEFDSSYKHNRPFEFTVGAGEVIQGWDLGLVGMKVGEKRKLTIPSNLGYGERGAGNVIPPDSTLIFEIELLEIK